MDDVRLVHSPSRGTWNVIVNGEWYYESTNYEQAENVFNSFFWEEEPEYVTEEEAYYYE